MSFSISFQSIKPRNGAGAPNTNETGLRSLYQQRFLWSDRARGIVIRKNENLRDLRIFYFVAWPRTCRESLGRPADSMSLKNNSQFGLIS
jgi:hypothetical protein